MGIAPKTAEEAEAALKTLCDKHPELAKVNAAMNMLRPKEQVAFLCIASIVSSRDLPKGQFVDIVKAAVTLASLAAVYSTLELSHRLEKAAPSPEAALRVIPIGLSQTKQAIDSAHLRFTNLLEVLWPEEGEANGKA